MSMPRKIFVRTLEQIIKETLGNTLEETQYGFRKGRTTQLCIMRELIKSK